MADHFRDATKKVDFIRREAAYSIFINSCDECKDSCVEFDGIYPDCGSCLMGEARRQMLDIPAADVVEVVRCKDCINWNGNDCITMYGLSAPRPNDYCSRGEKNSG
jgi:hypothetical protein